MPRIEAGYRLIVVSWENDGDHYSTLSKDGLSEDSTKLIIALCKLLHMDHPDAFGNMEPEEVESSDIKSAVQKVFEKYPVYNKKGKRYKDIEECYEYFRDMHHDLFGDSDYYENRVYESHRVEYYPEPYEPKDVTKQFK